MRLESRDCKRPTPTGVSVTHTHTVGVQIRAVQRMQFADEIKSYFCQSENSSGAIGSSPLLPGASPPALTSLGPHSTPVASLTQRIVGRDPVCRRAVISTTLGPRSTLAASSAQLSVGRDQVFQSAVMLVEKKYPTSSKKETDLVRDARKRIQVHGLARDARWKIF